MKAPRSWNRCNRNPAAQRGSVYFYSMENFPPTLTFARSRGLRFCCTLIYQFVRYLRIAHTTNCVHQLNTTPRNVVAVPRVRAGVLPHYISSLEGFIFCLVRLINIDSCVVVNSSPTLWRCQHLVTAPKACVMNGYARKNKTKFCPDKAAKVQPRKQVTDSTTASKK